MRSPRRGVDAGALDRVPDQGTHTARSLETAVRRSGTQEHATAGTPRAPRLQVGGDRFADLDRQGKLVALATLAAYMQLSRVPVDVIEFETCHFARTQAQSCEQQQDGIVTTPCRLIPIDAAQQLTDFIGCDRPGDRRHRPVRHDRYGDGQIPGEVAPITRIA